MDNTTDATFRTWVAAVLSYVDALPGWTRTADTGQVNTTTAVRSASSAANYAVWKTTSAGLADLYLRLDFAAVASAANPGMGITGGYATNGAGSITGTYKTARIGSQLGQSSATATRFIISGAAGRFAMAWATDAANTAYRTLIGVERAVSAAGAYVDTGFFAFGANVGGAIVNDVGTGLVSSGAYNIFIPSIGSVMPSPETKFLARLTTNTSSAAGLNVKMYPVTPEGLGGESSCTVLLAYKNSDFTSYASYPVTVYGTSMTFYAIGDFTTFVGADAVTFTNGRIAMRVD